MPEVLVFIKLKMNTDKFKRDRYSTLPLLIVGVVRLPNFRFIFIHFNLLAPPIYWNFGNFHALPIIATNQKESLFYLKALEFLFLK